MGDTDARDPNAPPFCPVCAVRMTLTHSGSTTYWTCRQHGQQPTMPQFVVCERCRLEVKFCKCETWTKETPPACPTCGKPQSKQRTGTMVYWICAPCWGKDNPIIAEYRQTFPKALGNEAALFAELCTAKAEIVRLAQSLDRVCEQLMRTANERDEARQASTILGQTVTDLHDRLLAAQADCSTFRKAYDHVDFVLNQVKAEREEALKIAEARRVVLADHERDWEDVRKSYEHSFPDRPWGECPRHQRVAMLVCHLRRRLDELSSVQAVIDERDEAQAKLTECRKERTELRMENSVWQIANRQKLDGVTLVAIDRDRYRLALLRIAEHYTGPFIRQIIANALLVTLEELSTTS